MPKTSTDVSTLLIRPAADLRALLRYLIEVVELQQHEPDLKNHEQAAELLDSLVSLLCRQVERLDQYLASRGNTQPAVQAATSTMAGAFLGFITKLRSHETAKILRDDFTLLNLAALNFLTLHTTAITLNDVLLASLAAKGRLELQPVTDEIARLLPVLVQEELNRTLKAATNGQAQVTSRTTKPQTYGELDASMAASA